MDVFLKFIVRVSIYRVVVMFYFYLLGVRYLSVKIVNLFLVIVYKVVLWDGIIFRGFRIMLFFGWKLYLNRYLILFFY